MCSTLQTLWVNVRLFAGMFGAVLPWRSLLWGLLFVTAPAPASGQVCVGDRTLRTQAAVDVFTCTEVTGTLRITGHDIGDLSPLSVLSGVGVTLEIGNTRLASLAGLENVTSIGWTLWIHDNASLTSLTGLSSLTSLSHLTIQNNDALGSLAGMERLAVTSSQVNIQWNDALVSLAGLENLTAIRGYLNIEENNALVSLAGIENLRVISSSLDIIRNDALVSLAGLRAGVNGIRIDGNPVLTTLEGIESLAISGSVHVTENNALTSLAGLEALSSSTYLQISRNDALTSLAGLENVTTVQNLLISDNDALTSLAALSKLTAVDRNLTISGNGILPSLTGLEGLRSVREDILIQNNDALTSLEGLAGLSSLTTFGRQFSIQDNDALESLEGLENLSYVRQNFFIGNNASLASLKGLENLAFVTNLTIENNDALESLGGLEGLTTVSNTVSIKGNDALTSLNGFENVAQVHNLLIENNATLAACSCGLEGLIAFGDFTGVAGTVSIANNNPDGACTSPAVVLATPCDTTPPQDTTAPVCGEITIEHNPEGELTAVNTFTADPESGIAAVRFFRLRNMLGFLNDLGFYRQGQTQAFNPATTTQVTIRATRIKMSAGGHIVVEVQNGAGLTSLCDPVVERLTGEVPTAFALQQNYPNPFNPETVIAFELAEARPVNLVIYDVLGRAVATLVDAALSAGRYTAVWDGRTAGGEPAAGGVYLYRLRAGSFVQTRTLTLLR